MLEFVPLRRGQTRRAPRWMEVLGSQFAIPGLMIISNSANWYFLHIRLVQIANNNRSFNFVDWNICEANFDDYLLIGLSHRISENYLLSQHVYLLYWCLTLSMDLISGFLQNRLNLSCLARAPLAEAQAPMNDMSLLIVSKTCRHPPSVRYLKHQRLPWYEWICRNMLLNWSLSLRFHKLFWRLNLFWRWLASFLYGPIHRINLAYVLSHELVKI